MDKRPDFGKDLQTLSDRVTVDVGSALKALRESKPNNKSQTEAPKHNSKADVKESGNSVNEKTESVTPSPQRRKRSAQAFSANESPDTKLKKNITLRIYPETNELLSLAASWQKGKRRIPCTRQDITQEALEDWFRKHGYSLSNEE